jgi:oligopeptide/dipeptide ABC transporter ATP-binding protein
MYAGRIVERASVDQIASNPLHPYTRALIASIPQIGEPELVGIPGTPPVLGQEIRGCAFADRCMHASDRCRAARPNAVEVEKGHEVACWLYAGDEEGAQA